MSAPEANEITINGSVTESAATTFTQTTEDLSDLVDIRSKKVLAIKEIEIDMPLGDEVPATTANEQTTVQITHTSKTGIIYHSDEDLIYKAFLRFQGFGTAANAMLINNETKTVRYVFPKDDRPLIFHKTLYISILSTDNAAQTAYYRITCIPVTITDTQQTALLADISEAL